MRASAQITADGRLSAPALTVLMDLLENKLGCMEVFDREDARERKGLEHARAELLTLMGRQVPPPARHIRTVRAAQQVGA